MKKRNFLVAILLLYATPREVPAEPLTPSISTAAVQEPAKLPRTAAEESGASENLQPAQRLYYSGQLTAALEAYRPYVAQDLSALLQSDAILRSLGLVSSAVDLLIAAKPVFGSDPRWSGALAWSSLLAEKYVQARELYRKTPLLGNRDLLGQSLTALLSDDPGDALVPLKELAAHEPTLALSYFLQAKAYDTLGRSREAIEACQEAVKRDAFFGEARLYLAQLLEKNGRLEDSWKSYARLLQFDSGDPRIYEGLRRIGPHLSRKASEVLPAHRIAHFTSVTPAPGGTPTIRIGIGTLESGKPSRQSFWEFRCSSTFAVIDRKSGKRLGGGATGGAWKIQLANKRGQAALLRPDGTQAALFKGAVLIRAERGPATFIVNSLRLAASAPSSGMADKELRGKLEIRVDARHHTLILVNLVPAEEYLYGVLAAEMPQHWPLDALKSQAVISRTMVAFCRRIMHPHQRYGYDLCDSQHCQVYTGVGSETPNVYHAVDGTHGRYVAYGGLPAHTIFSSNCGGHTQRGGEVGWGDVPYWQSVSELKGGAVPQTPSTLEDFMESAPDAYCNAPQFVWPAEFRWVRVVAPNEIRTHWAERRRIGELKGIVPLKRSAAGNVVVLQLQGTHGNLLLKKEHEIRRLLTLAPLRSTHFIVHTIRDNGKPRLFIFFGGGWGHGIGLCQSGAAGRALAGFAYEQILAAYYPGTTLQTLKD